MQKEAYHFFCSENNFSSSFVVCFVWLACVIVWWNSVRLTGYKTSLYSAILHFRVQKELAFRFLKTDTCILFPPNCLSTTFLIKGNTLFTAEAFEDFVLDYAQHHLSDSMPEIHRVYKKLGMFSLHLFLQSWSTLGSKA